MSADRFDLRRFVEAQERDGAYEQALEELHNGQKRSHWIWFVFPQIAGLGLSQLSQLYAISSLDEASAYLAHPLLGPRLVRCARALLELPGRDPVAVMGEVDALKLRSSMTLFARVDGAPAAFSEVLVGYYGGRADEVTERLLGRG